MNTLQSGQFRWIIFKDAESNAWIGAALEFNIVVTGEDPRLVELELNDAVVGYLEAAKKVKGFRPQQINTILNQEAEAGYESRWAASQEVNKEGVLSPLSADIYKAGVANLAFA
jgi:hypothetical protein